MIEPLDRVKIKSKNVFGEELELTGLIYWIRTDLCGVLLDCNGQEEVYKTLEVECV